MITFVHDTRDSQNSLLNVSSTKLQASDKEVETSTSHQATIEDLMKFLTQRDWINTQQDFLQSLAGYLQSVLDIDYVLLTTFLSEQPNMTETIILSSAQESRTEGHFPIAGSLSQHVVERGFVCRSKQVQKFVPQDILLRKLNAESGMGILLRDAEDQPLGILGFVSRKQVHDLGRCKAFLQIASLRVAHILEHYRNERDAIRQNEMRQLKEDALSNIRHDFNNVLSAVSANFHMLKKRPVETIKRIDVLDGQIRRLSDLGQQLLQISRSEGDTAINKQQVDLNVAVSHVVQMLSPLASTKGLSLQCMPLAKRDVILADRQQLERVIVNLLTNAIRYTPAPGTIEVETLDGDGEVILAVRDTGIGISEDDLPKIFKRFYRSHTTREAFDGSGLGLSIVKEIIDQYQGRVEVESTVNTGSTFRVFLPAK